MKTIILADTEHEQLVDCLASVIRTAASRMSENAFIAATATSPQAYIDNVEMWSKSSNLAQALLVKILKEDEK